MRDSGKRGRESIQEAQQLCAHVAKLERVSQHLAKRKSADEELDKAWGEWEKTFDATKDSIMVLDSERKIVQANVAASRFFRKPLDQIVGKTCWHVVHGTKEPPKECPLKEALYTKKHEETELYLPEKGVWIEVSVDPILDDEGNVSSAVHIIRDITERKRAERSLRKERDRAHKYLDVAAVMLVAIDTEQRVGLINKKGCEILGYQEEEIIAKNWFDNFLPERIREEVRAVFEKFVADEADTPEYYENPVLTKKGDERLIAWHNTILRDEKGNVIATLSSGEDITERKAAEEVLRESEGKWRSLVENAPSMIIIVDCDGRIRSINRTVSGFNPEEAIGTKIYDYVGPQYHNVVRETIEQVFQTGDAGSYEIIGTGPNGSDSWYETQIGPIKDDGQVVAAMLIATDISQRKQAEEALRQSESKYRETSTLLETLLNGIPDVIGLQDRHHGMIRYNDAGYKFVNRSYEEVKGKKCYELIGRDAPCQICATTECYKTKRPARVEKYVEEMDVWLDVRAYPILDESGKIVYVIEHLRDISDRKRTEQKLIEDQVQLRSLASQLTLAEERERRRIATELHDRIGQALAVAKIKLEGLRHSVSPDDNGKTLEEVCQSLGQAIADTRSLTFELSSPMLHELGFETAVAAWLIDQIERKHGIATEFVDDEQLKPLDGDMKSLLFRDVRELLINVVKHARANKVNVSIRRVGGQIHVSVQDDGVGFDPGRTGWMTTKAGGFGLFSIRERLEELGGHLEIKSKPGRGCKVTMMAPLKDETASKGKDF